MSTTLPLGSGSTGRAGPALEVKGLVKRYGAVEAVAGVSFTVEQGEIFGLLGPNGAGKTSLISVLSTQRKLTAGDARVFGWSVHTDVAEVRRLVGVVPQEISLYPMLTAAENLRFFGRIYLVRGAELEARIERVLDLVGLEARAAQKVVGFSGGMKRRLNLAASLIQEPRVVLMDEPTAGVDPQSRESIFHIVRRLRDSGVAILYTTHYMEEAEQLCDRLGIMDEGRLIALGRLETLLSEAGLHEVIEIRGLPASADLSRLSTAEGVYRVESKAENNGVTRVYAEHAAALLARLDDVLRPYSGQVSVEIARLSLERFFLHLTGKKLRD